eukprot:11214617-Lingulodinium_polyedra.AAC.1
MANVRQLMLSTRDMQNTTNSKPNIARRSNFKQSSDLPDKMFAFPASLKTYAQCSQHAPILAVICTLF